MRKTDTPNVFNLYAWVQLQGKAQIVFLSWVLVFPGSFAVGIAFTKKGARQCEGGGAVPARRLGGPAPATDPREGLHKPAHSQNVPPVG